MTMTTTAELNLPFYSLMPSSVTGCGRAQPLIQLEPSTTGTNSFHFRVCVYVCVCVCFQFQFVCSLCFDVPSVCGGPVFFGPRSSSSSSFLSSFFAIYPLSFSPRLLLPLSLLNSHPHGIDVIAHNHRFTELVISLAFLGSFSRRYRFPCVLDYLYTCPFAKFTTCLTLSVAFYIILFNRFLFVVCHTSR